MIGIICGCEISDRFGRKSVLLYCSIISIIGGIGVTAAQNMAMLLVFRFLCWCRQFCILSIKYVCVHYNLPMPVAHTPQHQDTYLNLRRLTNAVCSEP